MPNKPFVIRDEMSSTIEDILRTFSDSQANHDINRTFHPDGLTECGRKLIYRTSGSKYQTGYSVLETESNYFSKLKWIHILKCCKDIKVLDSDIIASDDKHNLLTKVDCVIEMEDETQIVVFIKSLSSSDFENVKNNGATRKDIVRIITDMWLIELSNGIIIYENRDTLRFLIYKVIPNNAIINTIKLKSKNLYDNKIKGILPSRPYKNNSSKECQECEFLKTCW